VHTQQQAQAFGDKLASRLGANWRVEVWENLGWHTAVWLDGAGLSVHINHGYGIRATTFSAFLNAPEQDGRPLGGIWAEGASTPEEAIKKVIDVARAEVERKQWILDTATEALEKSRQATWEVASVT
jgi:hypothetical protein